MLLSMDKIDVNAQDKFGWTALMEAVKIGDLSLVINLLRHPGIRIGLSTKVISCSKLRRARLCGN